MSIHMPDKIFRVSPGNNEQLSRFLNLEITDCISTLSRGGVIVFPTETLYGLGVDIMNDRAIDRLIALKRRPKNMPIAVAVAGLNQAEELAEINDLAEKIIKNCLPKPITILLPASDNVNQKLTAESDLIGLRFPSEPVTVEILRRFGPITATSANLHGSSNPVNIDTAIQQLGGEVDIYIDTGPCKFGKSSTVVDVSKRTIKIIRDGACSGEELEDCLRRK